MPDTTHISDSMIFMQESDLIFGTPDSGTDFAASASSIRCAASGTPTVFQGLKKQARYLGPQPWTLDITLGEDYADAESFANWLWDHDGETLPVEFAPVSGGTSFSGLVTIVSPGIGGAGGSVATSSISLEMPERPTRTIVAPTP